MASKQAACLNCRKSKIRCKRDSGAHICEKCQQAGVECVIPSFHVGRQKGVKNKRTGLQKAIFQIEEAIKKSKSDPSSDEATTEHLQQLLNKAREGTHGSLNILPDSAMPADREGAGQAADEHLALDDAENPLQLLARASDLRLASPKPGELSVSTPSSRTFTSERGEKSDVYQFFLPIKANLDQGADLDPVDLGLVTVEEAEMLMSFFHERLAHTRWGLDPAVHTLHFVRYRSSFLFTSLLTASAMFLPTTAALCTRLLLHKKFLAEQVIARRFRSVEIVLAFMVNVPWMHPGSHASDDDTGLYISTAASIALDLSLNKIIVPSRTFHPDLLKRVPRSECLDARKALAMDGHEDIDCGSEWGQRLLRRRERVWIALFVLERGVCLARGRSFCLPVTPLVKHCDSWHISPLSDAQDGPLVSMAALRRDLDELFSSVRSRCDSYRMIGIGAKVAEEIEATIESFFSRWLATWSISISGGEQRSLPPYVEILLTHTRLSTYSGVINHPTAPLEVKRLFRASALSSALNVMRAAIQGEARLKSMPNNTVTMICFAACVALHLSAPTPTGNQSLAPSVRNLIEETATVLERIGSTPTHRNGASVIYGKYLRELVRQAPEFPRLPPIEPRPPPAQPLDPPGSLFPPATDLIDSSSQAQHPLASSWDEPLQFSTMSGNEVIETVMNVGDFNSSLFDFPMQDVNELMWMDWMNPPDFGFQ